MPNELNTDQMDWLDRLNKLAKQQVDRDASSAQKNAMLDKLTEQREKNMDKILEGMKITVGRPTGKKGKLETNEVAREDQDQLKSYDADEERQGYRVTDKKGKAIEGELTEKWAEGQEFIQQPEFEKFSAARHLLIQMTDEVSNATVDTKKKGKTVKKPLFKKKELMEEVYDPLVRRGVPETLIGNDYSRTQRLVKGSFKKYAARLEEEDLKGFASENKDLGIAILRMCISLPGNIMTSDGATQLLASQQQASTDPVHVFHQNFGMVQNDSAAGVDMGEYADNLQKAVQSWAFIQNVSDLAIDGVKETAETGSELNDMSNEKEQRKAEKPKSTGSKLAPIATQSVIAAMAVNMAAALGDLGSAGSTVFSAVVKRREMAALLAKDKIVAKDVTDFVTLLGEGIDKTFDKLLPATVDRTEINKAATKAKDELAKVDAGAIVTAMGKGKLEDVVTAFSKAATSAGKLLAAGAGPVIKANAKVVKAQASDFVSDNLREALEDQNNPESDDDHNTKEGHDPDWIEVEGKTICLKCKSDTKDLKLFAGILDRKIAQLKKEELYFKLAVNVGGLAFDVAANFLAPLLMGGALLRMSRFIFLSVKRWIDFSNFCDSKEAMMNAASSFSPAVRRFRDDSRRQGIHYTINAACEGVKVIGACLQCSPAVIGGIIAAQAATGTEAVEAVLYEISKRYQLSEAWQTYKVALQNPDNRKLSLIAIRENPTLAKYAIAWGAVVEEDPLVGDFMSYCGVNSETLEGNAKIDKVVEYLEARMPDDIEVTGRRYAEGESTGWAPSKVSLTADSWIDAKAKGETQGGVVPVDTSAIESALIGYEAAHEAVEDGQKGTDLAVRKTEIEAALKAVHKAWGVMKAYVPKDANHGGEVAEMVKVRELFVSKLELDEAALKSERTDVMGKIAKAKKGKGPAKAKVTATATS